MRIEGNLRATLRRSPAPLTLGDRGHQGAPVNTCGRDVSDGDLPVGCRGRNNCAHAISPALGHDLVAWIGQQPMPRPIHKCLTQVGHVPRALLIHRLLPGQLGGKKPPVPSKCRIGLLPKNWPHPPSVNHAQQHAPRNEYTSPPSPNTPVTIAMIGFPRGSRNRTPSASSSVTTPLAVPDG